MKKLVILSLFFCMAIVSVQAQYINVSDGTSFVFVAPDSADVQVSSVLFPIGDVQAPAYAATLAVNVNQMETFVQPAELTGNMTINLTVNSKITEGAKIYVKLDSDGTERTVTPGTGFDSDAPAVVVAISSIVFVTYIYDGTTYVPAN